VRIDNEGFLTRRTRHFNRLAHGSSSRSWIMN
jgi:hypothetical protein